MTYTLNFASNPARLLAITSDGRCAQILSPYTTPEQTAIAANGYILAELTARVDNGSGDPVLFAFEQFSTDELLDISAALLNPRTISRITTTHTSKEEFKYD